MPFPEIAIFIGYSDRETKEDFSLPWSGGPRILGGKNELGCPKLMEFLEMISNVKKSYSMLTFFATNPQEESV
jgi:hypothetical protein